MAKRKYNLSAEGRASRKEAAQKRVAARSSRTPEELARYDEAHEEAQCRTILTNYAADKIIRLSQDNAFVYHWLCSTGYVWISRTATYGTHAERPTPGGYTVAVVRGMGLTPKEAKAKIREQEQELISFMGLATELAKACEWWNSYGVYYFCG